MIEQKDWIWRGLPGHYCCADDCIFRLCTDVGKYRISTVGAMYWDVNGKRVLKQIGYQRHYETMVFVLDGDKMNLTEIDMDGIYCGEVESSNEDFDEQARQIHIKMCEKYAQDEWQNKEYSYDDDGFFGEKGV